MKFLHLFRAIPRHYRWLLAKDDASAFPATCDDTAHGVAAGKVDPQAGLGTTLRKFFFSGNWKVENREMPRFQIQGEGRILETFVASLIGAIGQKKPNSRVGWSWDGDLQEGSARTLRVVDRVGSGHLVTTDVSVFQRDGDLFIGMGGKAWSKMRFLTRTVGTLIVACLFVLIMSWVIRQPGFRKSWVRDFAKKHAETRTVSYPNPNSRGPSQSFTQVEPLEAFIGAGSTPSSNEHLDFLSGLMLRSTDDTEHYDKLLREELENLRTRCLGFRENEFEQTVDRLIHSNSPSLGIIQNIGVFPVRLNAESAPIQHGIATSNETLELIWNFLKEHDELKWHFYTMNRQTERRNSELLLKQATENGAKLLQPTGKDLLEIFDIIKTAEAKNPGAASSPKMAYSCHITFNGLGFRPGEMDDELSEHYSPLGGPYLIERNDSGESTYRWKPDVTPGLLPEESANYFYARVALHDFSVLLEEKPLDARILWEKDPDIRRAMMTYIRLGHKTRIPPLNKLISDLNANRGRAQHNHPVIVGYLLYLAWRNENFDSLIEKLPQSIKREFNEGMEKQHVPPWSTFKLFNADWLLFLTGPAKVPALIFGALIALTMLMPRSGLRLLCSILRWPSPQTFDQAIASQNTTIQGMVGTLLRSQFRITQDRIIEIRNRA